MGRHLLGVEHLITHLILTTTLKIRVTPTLQMMRHRAIK